jgi:CHAD domain-containing protein
MAKPRPIEELSPEEAYGAAAAKILAVRSQELADHSAGVLDLSDPDRLHDMRVATRRLRAALEVFEACFPRKLHRSALADAKRLTDVLGRRRDRDVAIGSLEAFAEKLSAPDRRGVEGLIDTLRLEQAEANEDLRPHVTEERVAALCERLGELVAEAEAAGGLAGEPTSSAPEPPRGLPTSATGPSGNGSGAPE